MTEQSSIVTYDVANMRIVVTEGKVKEKNPDRLLTVHGDFRNVDAKGKPIGDVLTFHSKEVTLDMARNPLTVIDKETGTLTLPSGERGRKALAGIGADAVANLLAEIRGAAEASAEANAEASAEASADQAPSAEQPSA